MLKPKKDMKKTLIIISLVICTVCSACAVSPARVSALAREYNGKEGFEVVSMGRFLISAIGVAARAEADPEDVAALKAFKGIKHLTIVDFEDASAADKSSFQTKLGDIFDKMDLILEAKEDGDDVKIFGKADGEKLRDIIIYCKDEALICVNGSIDMDKIGALIDAVE